MDWVSFDEIKKTVSLQMVLERYGIPLRKVGPGTLRGKCPLPMHRSETSKESFTATLTKGTGGAWACQSQSCIKARGRVGGNVLDFVAAMEQCSVRDAAIKLQMWFLVPMAGNGMAAVSKEPPAATSAGKEPEHDLVSKKENDGGGESESNKPLSFTLQNIDHTHPYLRDRGLTEETAKTFAVGFFPGKGSMHDRIVIPINNPKGELVAYAGRAIDGSEPRYKFPSGFHKSQELYNLDRVKGEVSVVLVEGFFDCMKVTQAGYPCVALMGSTMSKVQEELLGEHFGHVVVMLDGDEAGMGASEEIVERLRRVVYQVDVVALTDGVQPDTLSEQEVRALLER
ncbi:MAG TPA: toprim domain-containing protein [Bryobacteraceae bacterium]|nr:toprim domain-containing protein [Bryobacteraceae bacterium]